MGLKRVVLLFLIITFFIITIFIFMRKPEYYQILSTKISNPTRKYSYIRELTKCSDSEFETRIVQKGDYFAIYNYVKGNRRFKCHESITYTTHGDYSFMNNIVEIVNVWQGPISVALYTPAADFIPTVERIAYLRNCRSPLIKEFVTFHVYFPSEHFPETEFNVPMNEAYSDVYLCHQGEPNTKVKAEDLYRRKKSLIYPINVGRNVAIQGSQTHFILSSDIEQYPSKNFISNFLNMIGTYEGYKNSKMPKVFVVPVFEITEDSPVPQTKSALVKMVEEKKAFWFHQKLCPDCHKVAGSENWLQAAESSEKFIHTTAKRTQSGLKKSEPIFVGTVNDPFYDERFSWEGLSDKLSQAYVMCLLDYEFVVLLNEFLIHKPGIATGMESLTKFATTVYETNEFVTKVVKPEMETIYGSKDGCIIK